MLCAQKKEYDELRLRFEAVKSDLVTLKTEFEQRDRERVETIENLVAEYSKLAAETELMQQKSNQRIAEVIKENEVLVTKLHALEHSIQELADRTASQSAASTSAPSAAIEL